MMLFMAFLPLQICIFAIMAGSYKNKFCCDRKIRQFGQSRYKGLVWNDMIKFYTSGYFFLSFIGWLSMHDIRLQSHHSATEKYSSLLGIVLAIYSVVFPVLTYCVVLTKIKPIKTLKSYELEEMKKFGTFDKHRK